MKKHCIFPTPISEILGLDLGPETHKERVQKRWDYIQEQLALDPNYVGWDYPEFFNSRHGSHGLVRELKIECAKDSLVSTKGEVIKNFRNSETLQTTFGHFSAGYLINKFSLPNKRYKGWRLHRVVGCTFIPIPEKLLDDQLDLVMDHDDGIKTNNDFKNLEWTTNAENTRKAVLQGLIKSRSLKATYMLDDEYYGQAFFVQNRSELIRLGLASPGVINSINGKSRTAFGCKWEVCENPDGTPPFPHEVLKRMKTPSYSNPSTHPIIGTVIKDCSIYGLVFCLLGAKEVIKAGFNTGIVGELCNGSKKRTHTNGVIFKYCSRLEMQKHQRGLSREQFQALK